MLGRAILAVMVAFLLLALPASAAARADTWLGFTSQPGVKPATREGVQLTLGRGGRIKVFSAGHKQRCGNLSGPLSFGAGVTRPRIATTRRFEGSGTYRDRWDLDTVEVSKSSVTGRRVSRYRWAGTFTVVRRLYDKGRLVRTCRLRRTRWFASLPYLRLRLTSDPGDYVLRGGSRRVATPGDTTIVLTGNRNTVDVASGEWTISFSARPGRRLHRGLYAGVRRYPFQGSAPGLSVGGENRGCLGNTGWFRIYAMSFDRRGKLRSVYMSFEQHCHGEAPALRGVLRLVAR